MASVSLGLVPTTELAIHDARNPEKFFSKDNETRLAIGLTSTALGAVSLFAGGAFASSVIRFSLATHSVVGLGLAGVHVIRDPSDAESVAGAALGGVLDGVTLGAAVGGSVSLRRSYRPYESTFTLTGQDLASAAAKLAETGSDRVEIHYEAAVPQSPAGRSTGWRDDLAAQ